MKTIKPSELAKIIGGEFCPCSDEADETLLCGLGPLEHAQQQDVAFLANDKYISQMAQTQAGAVIVDKKFTLPAGAKPKNLIRCDDAYLAFREAMVTFYGFREHPFTGLSDRAEIHPTAKIADGVSVAALASISAEAEIGPGTAVYPGAFVGPGCKIGRDCIVYPNVCLYEKTVLGDRVTVHANSSIGVDGFGYATHANADGVVFHDKIPTPGWVELEDDVEIGSCCCIERATMGATVIGAGTKFADQVAIGHGTKLGKHCLMVSQAGIAGSTIVGDYCVFAGQAGVVGHIKIGTGARIGAQAGVSNDIPAGLDVLGSPAIPRAQARRVVMATMKVPELRNNVKKLARQLADVQKRLAQLERSPDSGDAK